MTARPVRALLAVLAVFALIAAACSDDSGGDPTEVGTGDDTTDPTESSEPTETEPPESTEPTASEPPDVENFPSYEGVTADSIKVGVLTADLEELRESGLVDIDNGDPLLIWDTLIADFNADGGVAGRELEMVFELYNPVFNASAEEACVALTQDEEVFIVLGGVAGPARDSVLCFVELNETMMIGGTHTPAHFPRATVPWISLVSAADRRYTETIRVYDQEGLLEGNLAVLDDSTERDSLSVDVVIPALGDLGYDVTTHVTTIQEQGDEVAFAQQIGVFAERLAQDEIDTLLIVQSAIALGLANVREAGFTGRILTIDSASQLNTIGTIDERDPATYDGAYGPIGLSSEEIWETESFQECVATFEAANPGIDVIPSVDVPDGDPKWAAGLLAPCQLLDIFRFVAEPAGADLNPDTLLEAAHNVGSFEITGRPFNSLAEGKLDTNDTLRIGVFDSTIGLDGALAPVTDVQDIG